MNFTNKTIVFLILFIISSSCGYKLVGKDSSLPSHIQKIAIPIFQNTTHEPGIENRLTRAVREEFINDGRLIVSTVAEADLFLKGTLQEYSHAPVSFDRNDTVTEYLILLKVRIEAIDIRNNSSLIVNQIVSTKWDYQVSSSLRASESARLDAFVDASEDLGKKLVGVVVDRF